MTNTILASRYVADTIAFVIRFEHRVMPATAEAVFDAVEQGLATVYIPAMVFAEIMNLGEKGRISITIADAKKYVSQFAGRVEYPLDLRVIESAVQINDIPELHDRLIAGTARLLNLEIITSDSEIQASSFVRTIW